MKGFLHSDGTISTIPEEELKAIPEYRCKCGRLFRTSTTRGTCDGCIHRALLDSNIYIMLLNIVSETDRIPRLLLWRLWIFRVLESVN